MVSIAKDNTENLVNSMKSPEEQNYHGTHEFMHIFTVPAEKNVQFLNVMKKVKTNQDEYIEWLTNEGAAEFLIPYKVLLPMIKKYDFLTKGTGTYEFCISKAHLFGVAPVVMRNRINALAYYQGYRY